MKNLYIISVIILYFFIGCKKQKDNFQSTSNIFVINAMVGYGPVKVNANSDNTFSYNRASDIPYGGSGIYGGIIGDNNVKIVSSIDTNNILFSKKVLLKKINTFYLIGLSPAIDTLLKTEDNIPYIQSFNSNPDKSLYIRFVNLSPNSGSININIRTSSNNEISNLKYKEISEFKKYPALSNTPNYVFEVRDAITNNLLTSYTLNVNTNRYKTISLVIRGLIRPIDSPPVTGPTALAVFQVNYI